MKTQHSILMLLALAVFAACQPQPECPKGVTGTDINPNWEADIQLVADYVSKLTTHDMEGARAFLADNYKGYGPGGNDSTDREAVIAQWTATNADYANIKLNYVAYSEKVTEENKLKNLIGTWVQLWGTFSGDHKSGKTITFPFHANFRVENAKVLTSRIYYDRLQVLTDLGYTVTPPPTNQLTAGSE